MRKRLAPLFFCEPDRNHLPVAEMSREKDYPFSLLARFVQDMPVFYGNVSRWIHHVCPESIQQNMTEVTVGFPRYLLVIVFILFREGPSQIVESHIFANGEIVVEE